VGVPAPPSKGASSSTAAAADAVVELAPPMLEFEVIPQDKRLDLQRRLECSEFDAPRNRLIASDGFGIFCINPEDGSWKRVTVTAYMHEISCINPDNGNVVFRYSSALPSSIAEFFSVDVEMGLVFEVSLSAFHNWRWGFFPERLICLPGGEMLGMDDNDYIMTVDAAGDCKEFRHTSSDLCAGVSNDRGIFSTSGHSVVGWLHDGAHEVVMAGCKSEPGRRDGVGPHVRYGNLMHPQVNSRYLFVRDWDNDTWEWRFSRLDLETLRVETMRISGLSHDGLQSFCASDHALFAVRVVWDTEAADYEVLLLRAWLDPFEEDLSVGAAVASVDLSAPVSSLTFLVDGGAALHIDRRLLAARSAHFRGLLCSGMREARSGEVDLTDDADADEASVSVVLRYIYSGSWEGPSHISGLVFRVRALAHRWALPRLVDLAELQLHRLLGPSTVLSFLGRVVGTRSFLEEACWALMDARSAEIMQVNEPCLDTLIRENPSLAKRLLLWRAGSDRRKRHQPQRRSRGGGGRSVVENRDGQHEADPRQEWQ